MTEKLNMGSISLKAGESFADALKRQANDILALTEGIPHAEDDSTWCNINEARKYAEEKGVEIKDLSLDERKRFVKVLIR